MHVERIKIYSVQIGLLLDIRDKKISAKSFKIDEFKPPFGRSYARVILIIIYRLD